MSSIKHKENLSKQRYQTNSNSKKRQLIEELSESRIITKNLVYVIGLSSSIANKEKLNRWEYFGQYGTIKKIVVNKNKAYNQNSPNGPSYSAYVTFSKPGEASIAILSLDETTVDNHLIRASFGTTKYCSFFLKGIECSNKDCLFLHKLADESDIIKRGDLNSNKLIFAEQHAYAIKIADIYNPEVRKKLMEAKRESSIFPSPYLIYSSHYVKENDPHFQEQISQTVPHGLPLRKEHKESNKSPIKNKEKNIIADNITTISNLCKDGNIVNIDNFNNNGNVNVNVSNHLMKEHKLLISRDSSRFGFGSDKKNNIDCYIDVPMDVQRIINRKLNLYNITRYMNQKVIDKVIEDECILNTNKKDDWIEFILTCSDDNENKIAIISQQGDNTNDFECLISFVLEQLRKENYNGENNSQKEKIK